MFAFPTDNAGRTRLLPLSVPFRFFVAAAVFGLAGWLLLAHPDAAGGAGSVFAGGFGPAIAGLHALTLGVLAMTIAGASLQLLPVATVQAVRPPRLPLLSWWLLAPGTAVLVGGMALAMPWLALAGAVPAAAGLGLHAWMLGAHLAAARRQRAMTWHAWAGLACLLGVIASGPLLVLQQQAGLWADPRSVALAHLVLAGYGYAGLLATGFSYLLLPMFMAARGPGESLQRVLLGLALAALAAALGLLAAGAPRPWLAGPALLGLAAAGVHAWQLNRVLVRRRNQESPWLRLLIRFAWLALAASLVLAALLAAGLASPRLGPALVVLLVPGWLLSFLLAILLRIVPFLAAVHVKLAGAPMPALSQLAPAWAAWLAAAAQVAAVLLLAAAQLAAVPLLARAGALAGAVSAAALLVLQCAVLLRSRRLRRR